MTTVTREIAFIDSSIADWETLLAGLNEGIEVVILDQATDGLLQIADSLRNTSGISAIHVFSHGSSGELLLGDAVVNTGNLEQYNEALVTIGNALSETGDILLYGCNVAQGEAGQEFITQLAAYTGADVAASTDLTGNVALGGDWVLEAETGVVEAESVLGDDVGNNIKLDATVVESPWSPQLVTDPESAIQAGAFFAILSYGDANLQIGALPSWKQYRGLLDEGFDDRFAEFLAAGPQIGKQWTLLSDKTADANWTAAWSTELLEWESQSSNHHAQFSAGGLYNGYVAAAGNVDQFTDGEQYKEWVGTANQTQLNLPADDAWFGNSDALVALDKSTGTLVLSFRGTDAFDEAIWSGQAWTGNGLYLHYEAFRPLIDAVYDYAADAENQIQHIVVSGHSLGGAMADLFAIVDGRRFASLAGSDLVIVSLASPGFDPDVITDNAGGYGFSDAYDHALITVDGGSIGLQNAEWFSQYYFGFSHDRDRVYHAEEDEKYLQEKIIADLDFTWNETLKGNTNFAVTSLNLPNITNGQVTYRDDYGQDLLVLPFFAHGFGADHNGLIYWRNLNELSGSTLADEYFGSNTQRTIAFGVGTYATEQGWFTGGSINDRNLNGTSGNDFLLGLEGDDVLKGLAGEDLLDGGSGNDTLIGGINRDWLAGGAGDDTYEVDLSDDVVIEKNRGGGDAGGWDTVIASCNYVLPDYVEALRLAPDTGLLFVDEPFAGTGNSQNNWIEGNDAANVLAGLGGNDTLWGNKGNDTVDGGEGNDMLGGGTGNDRLVGGTGDDIYRYWLNDNNETILDIGGNDQLWLENVSLGDILQVYDDGSKGLAIEIDRPWSLDDYVITVEKWYLASDNQIETVRVDGMDLSGAAFIGLIGRISADDGTLRPAGDASDQMWVGTASGDTADMKGGNDSLYGLGGNDTLTGGVGYDHLSGGMGNDRLFGGDDADRLDGGYGNDRLSGDLGSDVLVGGDGNDALYGESVATPGNLVRLDEYSFNVSASKITFDNYGATNPTYWVWDNNLGTVTVTTGGWFAGQAGGALNGNTNVITLTDHTPTIGATLQFALNDSTAFVTTDGSTPTSPVLSGDPKFNGPIAVRFSTPVAGVGLTGGYFDAIGGTAIEAYDIYGNSLGLVTNNQIGQEFFGLAMSDGSPKIAGISFYITGSEPAGFAIDNLTFGTVSVINEFWDTNDQLLGGAGDDFLYGGPGWDWLEGGSGNDYVRGDTGTDTASYASAAAGVSVSLALSGQQNTVGAGLDTLVDIENLEGSNYADRLTGNAGNNVLDGLGGNDVLSGGEGNDDLWGENGSDTLYGGLGRDWLSGGAENDVLNGGTGADWLSGGTGDDMYVVDNPADLIYEYVAEGTDTVQVAFTAAGTYVLSEFVENATITGTVAGINVTGNAGSNVLAGNSLANTLSGGDGSDILKGMGGDDTLAGGLGNDILAGGTGNDVYVIADGNDTVSEAAAAGTDRVDTSLNQYILGANVEQLRYTGAGNFTGTGNAGANILTGGAGADTLYGLAGVDTLNGGTGNDVLDGGTGIDRLVGGSGNDTYVVNLTATVLNGVTTYVADTVVENAGEGTDTVQVAYTLAGTYTLGTNFENGIVTGTVAGINLIGNAGNNILTGNALANTLNGGTGVDTLIGGAGNDTYLVDHVGDFLVEQAGGGTDSARIGIATASTYVLGAEVEIATITSTAAVSLVGNGADNLLTGNAAANALSGGDGNDTLNGGLGSDTLIGGLGNDSLNGEADNDILGGGDGTDILNGGIGNDILFGELGNDTLNGGAGNDTLVGGLGNDNVAGGTGDDVYVIDDGNDIVSELAAAGNDRIDTGLDQYVLGANIEHLRYTGAGNFTGTGNTLANILTGGAGNDTLNGLAGNDTLNGNAGDDRLDGGSGIDRLVGGLGDDTYVVNTTAVTDPVTGVVTTTVDTVVEVLGEGTDTVEVAYTVAGTHTLAANVENGVITATIAGVNLNGNTLDNVLTGNTLANKLTGGAGADTLNGLDGNDTLDGGSGADSLAGGLGNDTYVVDHIGDILVEQADGGTDSASVAIAAATTYTLGEHVENATVTSTAAVSLVGNGADNLLTGNAAANRLEGGAGNDTLDGKAGLDGFVGGTGDDTYIIDQAGELARIIESADEGSDTLKIDYANASTTVAQTVALTGNLAAIDNVTVSGAGLFKITGNELDNSLTGNGSANMLDGGLGSDTLIGLGGNDTLIGGEGDDVLTGGAGNDLLNGGAGADRFVFTSKLAADADRIADFADGDLLVLQASVFTAIGASGALDSNAFSLGTTAATTAQHIIYDGSTGNLYYDADGSGVGAKVLVAALTSHPVLDAGDFWVA